MFKRTHSEANRPNHSNADFSMQLWDCSQATLPSPPSFTTALMGTQPCTAAATPLPTNPPTLTFPHLGPRYRGRPFGILSLAVQSPDPTEALENKELCRMKCRPLWLYKSMKFVKFPKPSKARAASAGRQVHGMSRVVLRLQEQTFTA